MKCPSCGTNNKDGMKFCKICGNSLPVKNNASNYAEEEKTKKSNIGLIVLIISIIVVLAAIGICVAMLILGNSENDSSKLETNETIAIDTTIAESSAKSTSEKETTEPSTVETIIVPDVIGLNQKDAEKKLEDSDFTVDIIESDSDTVSSGYVISQSPVSGKLIERGDEITIYVSKSKNENTTKQTSNMDETIYLYCRASDFATLRSTPSRSGNEIKKITTREKVEYLGQSGEFYYVSYNGYKGYVLMEFFSEDVNASLNYGTGNL